MVRVKLQEILDREERSLNWVATKTNIAYTTLHKLVNNKTQSISFDVLEKLCALFQVEISDMIEIVKE